MLQWGHGLAAVDGRPRAGPGARRPASMGPRPCGRGRHAACPTAADGRPASMGPRPCGRGRRVRNAWYQGRSACFNGATALRPWTDVPDGYFAAGVLRFNGATALRPWTAGPVRHGPGRGRVASMGPRPCGRGRLFLCLFRAILCVASMGPRPCGRGRQRLGRTSEADDELQWGHGLAAVDGLMAMNAVNAQLGLQWGHGLAAVDGRRRREGLIW